MEAKFKSILFPGFLVIVSFLFFLSCMEGVTNTEIDTEMSLNPTYAMPFVYGTYSLDKAALTVDTISEEIIDLLPWELLDSTTSYTFEINDTMDADLTGNFDQVEDATLYLTYRNGFPFDCEFNVILYDTATTTNIDTVIHLPILGTTVDSEGHAIITEGADTITMGDDFFSNMEESNQMIINSLYTVYTKRYATPDSLSDFSLWFHVGMKAKVSLK